MLITKWVDRELNAPHFPLRISTLSYFPPSVDSHSLVLTLQQWDGIGVTDNSTSIPRFCDLNLSHSPTAFTLLLLF